MRFWILPVIVFLLATANGQAQPYTWSGAGGNGSWANPTNWDTLPVSGNASVIILNVTTQTVTTQDFAVPTPFVLNRLQMNNGAGSGFVVNGSPIRIAGASAALQSASSGGSLVVNTAIDFSVSTAVNLNANFNAGPEQILNGRLSSSAGPVTLTVSGGIGTGLVLGGANNTFSGILAFASGAQTVVSLGAANTLTRTTMVDLTGAAVSAFVRAATTTATGTGFANAGFNQQLGSIQGVADSNNGITSGFFQVGATGGVTSTVLSGFDNTSTSLSADLAAGIIAAINIFGANSHFGKVGTGTFTYGGSGNARERDRRGRVCLRPGRHLPAAISERGQWGPPERIECTSQLDRVCRGRRSGSTTGRRTIKIG